MIGLVRTKTTTEVPVFQKEIEVAQGGFKLNKANLTGVTSIPAGSVLNFDEATRVAKVLKTATVHANAISTAVNYQVKKGHTFVVGDQVGKVVGGVGTTVTAIDTSNADYDILTVAATMAAAVEGDVIFESSAVGATNAALAVTPKGLLRTSLDLVAGFDHEVGAVIRGTVYNRRIPGASAEIKTALPHIIFSQSF